MPRLEVLGREAVEEAQGQRTDAIQRAEMAQNAVYKAGMLRYYSDNLKLQAKQADNEIEKMKIQKKADRFNYAAKAFEQAGKSSNPEETVKTMLQMFGDEFTDILSDPEWNKKMKTMQPSPEAQKDIAQARKSSAEANLSEAFTNRMNRPRGTAVGGQAPTAPQEDDELLIPEMTVGGAKVVDPTALAKIKEIEAAAAERGKPLSVSEADIVTKAETLAPIIDRMLKELERPGSAWSTVRMGKHGGLGLPFAQSRIAAFMQPEGLTAAAKKAATAGAGRRLGLDLQNIHQMLFAMGGGQALTETEAAKLKGMIDPSYKGEARYIADLKEAKAMLQKKAKLVTSPKGERKVTSYGVFTKGQDGKWYPE